MPIKRFKDETNVMGKWKIKCRNKKFYFHCFLWRDRKSFEENTLDNKPYKSTACVNLSPTILIFTKGQKKPQKVVYPKLGEIHFISGKWDMEVVAHELCHTLIHRLRMIKPSAKSVIEQIKNNEEDICYEFGAWVSEIYKKLWEIDKPKGWKKVKA